ncbi:metal-dependent amidase/aminoacylase/carboxypeptidase family protein [Bradyrhizobium sp. S3.9.2]
MRRALRASPRRSGSPPITANYPSDVPGGGAARLAPSMAGEDFAHYLKQRPGAFVWIGNGELRDGAELHGPRYDFNDAVLPVASTWMAEVAKAALASN